VTYRSPYRSRTEAASESEPSLHDAIRFVCIEVLEGLRHGYFECRVTSEVRSGDRDTRQLTFQAGKSHQFKLTLKEISSSLSYLRDGGAASAVNSPPRDLNDPDARLCGDQDALQGLDTTRDPQESN
jgi:hypothetical protein